MPSRQNVKTIVTPVEIMGDEAWIKIKNITLEEAREFQNLSHEMDKKVKPERQKLYEEFAAENDKKVKELTDTEKAMAVMGSELVTTAENFFYDYFSRYVLDWNWVEADGSAMPKPANNPLAFAKLTGQEFEWIQNQFKQDEKATKN